MQSNIAVVRIVKCGWVGEVQLPFGDHPLDVFSVLFGFERAKLIENSFLHLAI